MSGSTAISADEWKSALRECPCVASGNVQEQEGPAAQFGMGTTRPCLASVCWTFICVHIPGYASYGNMDYVYHA